uniref:Uncharacterized protein n=1 Tax=Arundo donax TaxID=35708 RepID=A0A0A9F499_ARUDO
MIKYSCLSVDALFSAIQQCSLLM